MIDYVSNREWAILILVAVAFLVSLRSGKIRASFLYALRSFFRWKVLLVFMSYVAVMSFLLNIASKIGYWEISLLKDTLVWLLFSGFALIVGATRVSRGENELLVQLKSMLAIAVIFEFLASSVSFGLPMELLLVSVVVVLSLIVGFSRGRSEFGQAGKVANIILRVIGLLLVLHGAFDFVSHWQEIDFARVIKLLILPPVLLGLSIPWFGLFAILVAYEDLFIRLRFHRHQESMAVLQKAAVVVSIGIDPKVIASARGIWLGEMKMAKGFPELFRLGQALKSAYAAERAKLASDAADKVRFAGVDGVDASGKRLDRREFDSTKDALHWLASCHMGWYRRNHRYRSDLLKLLGDFSRQGLPVEESGIEMHVAPDGQSWYAWRKTITGWHFAIGAAKNPPDQWLFEGPWPPRGFPGHDPSWGSKSFNARTPNW